MVMLRKIYVQIFDSFDNLPTSSFTTEVALVYLKSILGFAKNKASSEVSTLSITIIPTSILLNPGE